MQHDVLVMALAASSLAAGLVAGVFLTFSDFVMRGLGAAPGGARAMVEVNRTVYRSVFMVLLLGLVPACLALLVGAWAGLFGPAASPVAFGALAYLLGVAGTTALGNVPMNKRLDRMTEAQRAAYWPRYLSRWTALNHLRSVASALAAVALLGATLSIG